MEQLGKILNDLVQVHQRTLDLSYEKTETIKAGDTDKLSKVLMRERKYLQEVEQLEGRRQQLTEMLFDQHQIQGEERTMSSLLGRELDSSTKEQMEATVVSLVELMLQIKQNEQLNSDLIQQSMQFVQLSLEMMQPSVQNINYDGKSKEKNVAKNKSIFDSKA